MLRRFLPWFLAGCLLAGCTDKGPEAPAVVSPGAGPPAPVSTRNASRILSEAASQMTLFLAPSVTVTAKDTTPVAVPGILRSAAFRTAVSLALGATEKAQAPFTLVSPLGGTAVYTPDAGTVRVHFDGLQAPQGKVSGDLEVAGGTATLQGIVLSDRLGSTTVNGTFSFQQSTGPAGRILEVTSQLVEEAGEIRLIHHDLHARVVTTVLGGRIVSARSELDGEFELQGAGLPAGPLQVHTPVPFVYLGGKPHSGATPLTVTAGELRVQGTVDLLARITGPNFLALQIGGQVLRNPSWVSLTGELQAEPPFRPVVAEQLVSGGSIVTMDDAHPQAQALAVQDGVLLAVGDSATVEQFAVAETERIDLHGKTALPGLVEAHAHLGGTAMYGLADNIPNVVNVGSEQVGQTVANVIAKLTAALPSVKGKGWLVGLGYDPSRSDEAEEMRPLFTTDLDAVSKDVPIVVLNTSLHIAYVNTAAFVRSKVWPTAPNAPYPTSPNVIKDANGVPTGQLNEDAYAPVLVTALAEDPGVALRYPGEWPRALKQWASQGVTTGTDMLTGGFFGLPLETAFLTALENDPQTPVRLRCFLFQGAIKDPEQLPFFPFEGSDRLRYCGIKMISDGSTQGLSAAVNDRYLYNGPFLYGSPFGQLNMDDATLENTARPFFEDGWPLAIHANGDKAQNQVLSLFEKLFQGKNRIDRRCRMEHFTVHTLAELPGQLDRLRNAGLTVSMTIGHTFYWGEVFHRLILGAERGELIDPCASLQAAGIKFSLHSDAPVTPVGPLRYVQEAVVRKWQKVPQVVLGQGERISVDQALKAVTLDAAWMAHCDHEVGSLEAGKLADLVVLGANPLTVDAETIADIPIVATFLGGKRVSGVAP